MWKDVICNIFFHIQYGNTYMLRDILMQYAGLVLELLLKVDKNI